MAKKNTKTTKKVKPAVKSNCNKCECKSLSVKVKDFVNSVVNKIKSLL